MIRYAALIALAALVAPCAAVAQSSGNVAAAWGLLGTWQVECGGAPDDSNPVYSYRRGRAQAFLDRDFGGDRRDTNTRVSVRQGPRGEIAYTVPFNAAEPPQTREHFFVKSQDGQQMRIFSNRDADTGQYFVRDGKFTADGQTTPWFNRCY